MYVIYMKYFSSMKYYITSLDFKICKFTIVIT